MVLFFTHIPFVVNHTINATPRERLQHRKIQQNKKSARKSNIKSGWQMQKTSAK